MPVTGERSQPQGALAGLIAAIAGVPFLAIALVIAFVIQRSVVAKLLHQDVEAGDMMEGSIGFIANVVLAVLTGSIAAIAAGTVALKVIRAAATQAYLIVSCVGFLLTSIAIWRWLAPHAHGHAVALGVHVAIGWAAAVFGLYAAAMIRDEPDPAP